MKNKPQRLCDASTGFDCERHIVIMCKNIATKILKIKNPLSNKIPYIYITYKLCDDCFYKMKDEYERINNKNKKDI